MLVLDYVQRLKSDADDAALLVPAFHTGHLGFVPGGPVRVGVLAPKAEDERHCEVVVTRFDKDARDLGLLSVALRNERGVVARLMEAIAALGINVATQESSSVNALHQHTVNLLLDFSTATSLPPATSEPPVQRLYREYESVLPVHDKRYVALFDSIWRTAPMSSCGKRFQGSYSRTSSFVQCRRSTLPRPATNRFSPRRT